jgi:hypothetical protein
LRYLPRRHARPGQFDQEPLDLVGAIHRRCMVGWSEPFSVPAKPDPASLYAAFANRKAASSPITKMPNRRQTESQAAADLGPLSGNSENVRRCRLGLKQRE